jgi:signal transduction histidine kinase
VLEHLGLTAVLRTTSREFAERTGISVKLVCRVRTARLSPDTELALYRILQEILRNIERHASARHVTIDLKQKGTIVMLVIKDDGIGFDPNSHPTGPKGLRGLGLLSISERATYVGGTFKIRSVPGAGTEIAVTIPLPTGRTPAAPTKRRAGR